MYWIDMPMENPVIASKIAIIIEKDMLARFNRKF
jgi:hypothetical protein